MPKPITPAHLRRARDSASVALALLLAYASESAEEPIWIFEGADIKYYGVRIEMIAQRSADRAIDAKGKDGVLKLLEYVSNSDDLNTLPIRFFVDSDFDATHPPNPRLYVTPVYSIENFYVSRSAMYRILKREFAITTQQANRVADHYERWLRRFNRSACRLNAWVKLQRLRAVPGARLNLNNVPMNRLIRVQFSGRRLVLRQLYDRRRLHTQFPNAVPISHTDLEAERATLAGQDLTIVGRGKYLIEFFRLVLLHFRSDINSVTPRIFKQRKHVGIAITGNLLSELATLADTPASLRTFLTGLAPVPAP